MQHDEDRSKPYALPHTVHAKFWPYAAVPALLLLLLVLSVQVAPPHSEYRWQAYAFIGVMGLLLVLLLIWLASRQIVLTQESVCMRSLVKSERTIRYTDIRSVKVKVTHPYDTPSHRTNRYQLSITASNGQVMLIEMRSYHVRDLRNIVDAIVTHGPRVAVDATTGQLRTGQFLPRP